MKVQIQRGLVIAAIACALLGSSPSACRGDFRLWTDTTGDVTVIAELVKVDRGNVVLKRKDDGQEFTVALNKLSTKDRAFLKAQRDTAAAAEKSNRPTGPAQIAEQFYDELRGENRDAVTAMLTPKAQEVLKKAPKDKSPLADLPTPDEGRRSVRIGRASIDDKTAEVPVQVRTGGAVHKTKVHLRQEGDDWLIYAISEISPMGEQTFDFENPAAKEGTSSLDALVGKPFPLVGMTLDGQQVNIAQYQGKAVLVAFWATWSEPSRLEMKNIAANYEKFRDQGFEVIAVSMDQDLDALSKLLKNQLAPWAMVADVMGGERNSIATHYGIQTLPSSVLVGQDGKVVAVNCQGEALGQQLTKLFSGAEKPAAPPKPTPRPKP